MEPARPSVSDEEVVARVRDGELPLFELLMRRYNQRLYRVARAILRDEQAAEDVMQHAYVNAFAHLAQFEGRARFSTWLTRIAVHEALARARRRGRFARIDPAWDVGRSGAAGLPADVRPDPEQQAQAAELRVLLEAAIDALPEAYRAAFVLREAEGLDTGEVADCLEISEAAVRTRLHRARAFLRRRIHERTGACSASAFSFYLTRCDRVVGGVLTRLGLPLSPALAPPELLAQPR
jgi:RNA polymerase sigma-70 factor (ECF subfamily)